LCIFHTPLLFSAPAAYEVKHQETRVMGLLCGEGFVILTLAVFDWSKQTDGQTDGRAI